ncbi:MAG: transmembrane 220 family protein [Bacteroidota bacterium]
MTPTLRRQLIQGVMTLLFISWAYFQLNDPDSEPWVAMYLATAVLSGAAVFGKTPAAAPLGLVLFTATWLVILIPEALQHAFGAFFEEVEGEVWRESGGLLITGLWNYGLFRQLKPTSDEQPAEG